MGVNAYILLDLIQYSYAQVGDNEEVDGYTENGASFL